MDAFASMRDLARGAVEQMPPSCRFTDDDAAVVRDAKELLLALEGELVAGFYDTLFGHPTTAAVFHDGERPEREATLIEWWRRTCNGPLNEQYFAWMAMVGLAHVVRDVRNPSLLAMTEYVGAFVDDRVRRSELDVREAELLVAAFRRLVATVAAVVTHGYDQAIASALIGVSGVPQTLLRRLRDQEVQAALVAARRELRRP